MKRRNFIKNISRLSAAPLVLNGLPLSSFATSSMLPLLNCQGINDRILVILFLKGGNDGINTIVPIDQYDTYATIRPDIALANTGSNAIVNLDTTLALEDQVGLHPTMTAFKNMYESDQARLIQAVGYPSYNQSHFKSTDLWLSGGDGTPANFNLSSGWMGRYLESAYPGIHGNPIPGYLDPLGIQLGDIKSSLGLHNHFQEYIATNLTGQDPGNLFGLLNGLGTAPHATAIDSDFGDEIQYIMDIENSTNAYGQRITDVYNAGSNSGATYPSSYLASQLKTVARLIDGGSTTKIYLVHKSGFDTHAGQVESGAAHTGTHAELLADIFDSVQAFIEDLTNLGHENRVMTASFSEFGRRATQNGSFGTDHGTLAPMFLFGSAVETGVSGTNVDLSNLSGSGNLLEDLQYDYRGVFKTLLQDWLGAGDLILDEALFTPFAKVPALVNPDFLVEPECYLDPLSPLPITLTQFEARLYEEKQVLLSWETSSEINQDYFELEKSKDGISFESFAQVPGRGGVAVNTSYEKIDSQPYSGLSYYRLKSVDLDGSFTHSDIRTIEIQTNAPRHLKVYPNPAIYNTNLVLTVDRPSSGELSVVDVSGRQIHFQYLTIRSGFNKFVLDTSDWPSGQYFVHLKSPQFESQTIPLAVSL